MSVVASLLVLYHLSAACTGAEPVDPGGTDDATAVDSVTVAQTSVVLGIGQRRQLEATGLNRHGEAVAVALSWASSDPAVATVSSTGEVSALAVGTTTVSASGGRGKGKVKVRVALAQRVDLTPAVVELAVGDSTQLAAVALDSAGAVLTGRPIAWTTTAPAVASVSASGVVSGISAGVTRIIAAADGKADTATVTVTDPGVVAVEVSPDTLVLAPTQGAVLQAALLDAAGDTVRATVPVWSSTAPSIATVSASGTVSALTVGTAGAVASVNGRSDTTLVRVEPTSAGILITPATTNVQVGATTTLAARVVDGSGTTVPGAAIAWSSETPAIATVSAEGVVTGLAAGAATIRAESGNHAATATATVTPVPVATVAVAPGSSTVDVGQTVQLTATPLSSSGDALPGRSIEWSSSATGVVTVAASGLATAVGSGTATITAVVEGTAGTALVTVAPPPVASVTVTPSVSGLQPGGTVQLEVTLKDAGGTPLTGRAVAWSSSSPTVATVTAGGLVTALANGTAAVTVTSEGRSGSATVTVTSAPTTTRSGYYVSTTGSSTNAGTDTEPWSLSFALSHPAVLKAGDTIWVKGGTYRGPFTAQLRNVVLRALPGERVTIDVNGPFRVYGDGGVYWGLEFMSSETRRVTSQAGSWPSDIPHREWSVEARGPRTKFVNVLAHDMGGGFGYWAEALDAEIYGAVIYNNGWQGPDRGHGHGIYGQNNSGTKRIVDILAFTNFGNGMQLYGSDNAYVHNFYVEGSAFFNNNNIASAATAGGYDVMFGGVGEGRNFTFKDGFTYNRLQEGLRNRFGYGGTLTNVSVTGSHFHQDVWVKGVQGGAFQGNTIWAGGPDAAQVASISWDRNSYVEANSSGFGWNGGWMAFSAWKSATAFDAGSSFTQAAPSGQQVFVRPNRYERGRANVIVYNWGRAGSAAIDLSSVLSVGQEYEIRNAQNFFAAPVASGTYQGGAVTVPMSGLTAAQPIGGSPRPAVVSPEFAAFVVLAR